MGETGFLPDRSAQSATRWEPALCAPIYPTHGHGGQPPPEPLACPDRATAAAGLKVPGSGIRVRLLTLKLQITAEPSVLDLRENFARIV